MTGRAQSPSSPSAAPELVPGAELLTGGFRRIVVLLLSLVTAPTVLLLAIGILMLVFYDAQLNLVFGIMVVTMVLCLATGTVIALVFLRREAQMSQLQSDFVSKVSHELRTPLTSIRLFAETLQRDDVPSAELAACVNALASETGRLSERIERLLDWGRMEAGKREYRLVLSEVPAITTAALAAFDSVMMGRSAIVEVEIAEDLPLIQADRDAVVDALLNLLTNAEKYSGAKKQIFLEARADPKWVSITVGDKGLGIPHSEHKRIFQKFYRVDERLSRAVEGSGLGLAIVKHIADAHGGKVELDSHPGHGSRFTLLFPVPKASPGTTASVP